MPKKYNVQTALHVTPKQMAKMTESDLRERLYVLTTAANTRIRRLQKFEDETGARPLTHVPDAYNWNYSMYKIEDGKKVKKDYDDLLSMFKNIKSFMKSETSQVKNLKKLYMDSAKDFGVIRKKGESIDDAIKRAKSDGLRTVFKDTNDAIKFSTRTYELINELKRNEFISFQDLYKSVGWNGLLDIAAESSDIGSFAKYNQFTGKYEYIDSFVYDWETFLRLIDQEYKEMEGEQYARSQWINDEGKLGLKFD